jgi:hypothetical protein
MQPLPFRFATLWVYDTIPIFIIKKPQENMKSSNNNCTVE